MLKYSLFCNQKYGPVSGVVKGKQVNEEAIGVEQSVEEVERLRYRKQIVALHS